MPAHPSFLLLALFTPLPQLAHHAEPALNCPLCPRARSSVAWCPFTSSHLHDLLRALCPPSRVLDHVVLSRQHPRSSASPGMAVGSNRLLPKSFQAPTGVLCSVLRSPICSRDSARLTHGSSLNRNKDTTRDEFIFYSKRLMRLLIEHALSFLPLKVSGHFSGVATATCPPPRATQRPASPTLPSPPLSAVGHGGDAAGDNVRREAVPQAEGEAFSRPLSPHKHVAALSWVIMGWENLLPPGSVPPQTSCSGAVVPSPAVQEPRELAGAAANPADMFSSLPQITGVSILRAGETMEQALTAVCKDIRLGKILIQTNHDTGEPEVSS